jgi:hypothetical protein
LNNLNLKEVSNHNKSSVTYSRRDLSPFHGLNSKTDDTNESHKDIISTIKKNLIKVIEDSSLKEAFSTTDKTMT